MPNAQDFKAIGRGNGFSYCPQKVNVSSYNSWCTLSGHTSGPASQESINASLKAAMQLHWNSNLLVGSASYTFSDSDGNSATASVSDTKPVVETPRERVCKSQVGTGKIGSGTPGIGGASANAALSFKIVRMYNGSTSDEGNFVGYGVINTATADPDDPLATYNGILIQGTNNILTEFANVSLVSFTNSFSFTSDTRTQNVGITTISTETDTDIYFLCIASVKSPGPNGTFGEPPEIDTVNYSRSASASNRFASMGGSSSSVLFDGYDPDTGEEIYETYTINSSASASISDIDFYRY